ncbi:hypothetical protein SAY87_011239 [Trapa incisa]|uniref:Phosphoglycerate mutase-like protein AT74H n=1 Tax=Trapa incisa TaxID=236973 RepID=A0AAN7GXY6_9MYRT|nr:hypothetical protein SAY87_011239 [Trapa incisa]
MMTTLHLKLPSSTFPFTVTQCCSNPKEPSYGRMQAASINGNGHAAGAYPASDLLNPQALVMPPPRPRRIILVRHGQSEGNVDESAYTRVPDPKIKLTEMGKAQARECGQRIRKMIEGDGGDDWKVYFYVAPYKRTLQTLEHLGQAFERSRIAGVREEPRLREQDFGNFQDGQKMKLDKAKRIVYGRFFYRFPDGESAADVYDRITGFRETLKADIDKGRFQPPGEQNQNVNLVMVSHGLTIRVFLMRWYKWTVKQFERLHNLGNGNMIVMERGYGGRYSLLVHHSEEELREFGLTDDMLTDQEWQKHAKIGELNYECPMLNSFFPHLENDTAVAERTHEECSHF